MSCIGYRAVAADRWVENLCYNASENREPEAAAARVWSPHAVFISMCPLWLNTGFSECRPFPWCHHYVPSPQNPFWVIHPQATQRSSTAASSDYPFPHRFRVRGVIDHPHPEEMGRLRQFTGGCTGRNRDPEGTRSMSLSTSYCFWRNESGIVKRGFRRLLPCRRHACFR